MDVGNEDVGIVAFAILADGCAESAVALNEFRYFAVAKHFAAIALYLLYESVDEHVAGGIQSPAALYEGGVAVGEVKQRQGVAVEFHFEGRSRENCDEQRVGECLVEPLPRIDVGIVHAGVSVAVAEDVDIPLQPSLL